MNIGTMDGRVTAARRAMSLAQEKGMIRLADHDPPACSRNLGVALQAKVRVPLDEQLVIHGAMRLVTGRAALPHCLVLKRKVARLLAMTLGTRLIQPCDA